MLNSPEDAVYAEPLDTDPKDFSGLNVLGGGGGDLVPARVSITDSLHISFVTGLL